MIDFQEAISIKVGKWFIQKGFVIANCIGLMQYGGLKESTEVGLLYKSSAVQSEKYLFGLIERRPRLEFFGVVWLEASHGPRKDSWLFNFHGCKNTDWAKRLAEELASEFGINITLKLISEQPAYEIYLSDGGD